MNGMLNYMQRLKVPMIAIFLISILHIRLSSLRFLYSPIGYGAVISCGPAGPVLKTCDGTEGDDDMKRDSDSNLFSD
jgi:hypothetical protein